MANVVLRNKYFSTFNINFDTDYQYFTKAENIKRYNEYIKFFETEYLSAKKNKNICIMTLCLPKINYFKHKLEIINTRNNSRDFIYNVLHDI